MLLPNRRKEGREAWSLPAGGRAAAGARRDEAGDGDGFGDGGGAVADRQGGGSGRV